MPSRPGGVRYFSRLDDSQECWAIFDRVTVRFDDPEELSPSNDEHRSALGYACSLLQLPAPSGWGEV